MHLCKSFSICPSQSFDLQLPAEPASLLSLQLHSRPLSGVASTSLMPCSALLGSFVSSIWLALRAAALPGSPLLAGASGLLQVPALASVAMHWCLNSAGVIVQVVCCCAAGSLLLLLLARISTTGTPKDLTPPKLGCLTKAAVAPCAARAVEPSSSSEQLAVEADEATGECSNALVTRS